MSRKIILSILTAVFLGLVAGCFIQYHSTEKASSCSKQLFAMDTYMTFTAYGKNSEKAVDAAIEEVKRLDALLSTGSASSEISGLNAAGGGEVSADTAAILVKAQEIYDRTGGLFDFTIYPVMKLWGFPTKEYHVPTEAELQSALALVDASGISFDGSHVTFAPGQQIDFGGIAKGYTSARVMEIYEDYKVTSGMVSLGGNVQVYHTKPDGSKWNIGIRNPDSTQGSTLAAVSVDNKAVVTSGGYERYFEENGKTYIHIIDPRNGYPADQDLVSVSIISGDGTLADALSTSLYIMGLEKAVDYWRAYGDDFEMVLVTDDGKIYVSEGISEDFSTEEAFEVIKAGAFGSEKTSE